MHTSNQYLVIIILVNPPNVTLKYRFCYTPHKNKYLLQKKQRSEAAFFLFFFKSIKKKIKRILYKKEDA